ncbi:MAG: amidohydrolase, partial [Oscillospiraceae bacterium]|nr:amidohydrolase [Oscillospiraceae bacterium]
MDMVIEKIYNYIDKKAGELTAVRRRLHECAEISFREYETAEYIKNFYAGKPVEWIRHPVGENGVVVKIKGKRPGKTIALRGDFDAVELTEQTNLPYSSAHPGAAHACGHDAHTAILLAAADALLGVRDELGGDVVIIHQHAEEVPPGGAASMIKDGALEGVDAVLGGHIWSLYDMGGVYLRSGMTMAGRAYFKVEITGRGGHGSQPHLCADPILAGSHFVTALQSIVSRNINPLDSAVVTVGRFEGLGKFNVIPERVVLEGDARYFSEDISGIIKRRMTDILEGCRAAFGCGYELVYENDYPPVVNDETLAGLAKETMEKYPIKGLSPKAGAMTTGSEDFSYYQKKIPGLYVFFGAKPEGECFPHHHPKFAFNEDCMPLCAKFYAAFAVNFLNG